MSYNKTIFSRITLIGMRALTVHGYMPSQEADYFHLK